MNMISEQIKELRNYERIFNGDRIDGNLSPIFGNAANTIEELSEKLKNGCWIPCSERLPEDGVDVLVWYEYFRYGEYNRLFQTTGISYTHNGKWSGFVNGQSGWNQLSVIAWQPMPEEYHG